MEIFSGDPKDNHPLELEHQVETPQLRKSLIIYTSVDVASKTLKTPIDVRISCSNYSLIHFRSRFQIIFTLTPPTANPDKSWPAIVWKVPIIHFHLATFSYLVFSQTLHFEQTSQRSLLMSSSS